MDVPHDRLMEAASRGHVPSIDALMERCLPGLFAYVRARAGRQLRARDATVDLVQSACREVLADLSRCDARDEAGFRHWLYRAAERKIVDRARYHARGKRALEREIAWPEGSTAEIAALRQGYSGFWTPSREAAVAEELVRLEQALQSLPDDQREVIVLARIVGLPRAEIADRLGRSEGATRVLLHRALARLARAMGAAEDGA